MADISAPPGAWKLLGVLMEARRKALGFQYRTQFERERKLNKRMQADIEKAYASRINTWPESTLMHIAELYEVDFKSMLAVLHGDADALEPAAAEPPTRLPPMSSPSRVAADVGRFIAIERRLRELAAMGITDPDGAQVFPGAPDDAQAWDGIGARMDIDDRAWLIADLQRRADGRASAPGTEVNGRLRPVYGMHVHRVPV